MPSHERVLSVLRYDPLTGIFTWIAAPSSNKPHLVGTPAGRVLDTGYTDIKIDGCKIGAPRLAWFYMTGEWPKDEVDHKDLNKSNNAWDNLRESTHTQNMQNRPAWGSVPLKGVRLHECGKYEAKIVISKKQHIIGYFSTPEAAHDAYCVASNENFDEFARAA